MKPFLDSGFLLTLLVKTSGSQTAWRLARKLEGPLHLSKFQIFNAENRLRRQIESMEISEPERGAAANALQSLHWYLEQQVFVPVAVDYDIALDLANQWQKASNATLPALLLLWPALAATIGAEVFLSFDPRTRQLARHAGLKLLPERL